MARKCPVCDGAKRAPQPCATCLATRKIGCRSCGTWGFRVPELLAGVVAKEDAKAATLLLGRARAAAASSARANAAASDPEQLPVLDATVDEVFAYEERSRHAGGVGRAGYGFERRESADAVRRIDKALAGPAPAPK